MDYDLIVPAQIRAGRGLAGWTQEELAERAKVGLSTVKDIEAGKRIPIQSNVDAIRRALEGGGIKFLAANGDGPGVRLAGQRPQVIRWPTKRAPGTGEALDGTLPFMVAWRNRKVTVFLACKVLEDRDGVGSFDTDAELVASFRRNEAWVMNIVASAIDADRVDRQGRLYIYESPFE